MVNIKHIICFSGGHSSALVAIECVRKFGKENCILINHECKTENNDVARFENEIANYLGLPITYANIDWKMPDGSLPDQVDVCLNAGAFTSPNGDYLCTAKLKTEPFMKWLAATYPPTQNLFDGWSDCIIHYGFDLNEQHRITRRSSIMGALGYKTRYILAEPNFERTIFSTKEIGIEPPLVYQKYKHANCEGCLKGSLLHWYVTFCHNILQYNKTADAEIELDFTIHTVIRAGIKMPISLNELRPIFEKMKCDEVEATEHQSMQKFANLIRKYQIEELNNPKPCECIF